MKNFVPDFESGGLSVIGPVRDDNQDSIYLPNGESNAAPGLLFAVADGMGGYAHGRIASLLALESFSSTLTAQNGTPLPKALQRSVETANLHVYQKAQQLQAGRMGTTLTAAYVLGNILHLAHVGDSRAYLIRDGRATCLTSDHTTVGDMVRAKILPADKIRTHAQRSILTKAIGISLFVQPDIARYRLYEGDRLVLCSDGLWSVIEDDDLARVASESAPVELISQNLIDLALRHETDDNASTVVFYLRKLGAIPEDHDSHQRNKWFKNFRKLVS